MRFVGMLLLLLLLLVVASTLNTKHAKQTSDSINLVNNKASFGLSHGQVALMVLQFFFFLILKWNATNNLLCLFAKHIRDSFSVRLTIGNVIHLLVQHFRFATVKYVDFRFLIYIRASKWHAL